MTFSEFMIKYQALSYKKTLVYAFISLITGVSFIVIGAMSSIIFLIPLGFLFFFVMFGFVIYGAIKQSKTANERQRLIIDEAWKPLISSTKPLDGLEVYLEDRNDTKKYKGSLITELTAKSTQMETYYRFKLDEEMLYFIYSYHMVNTGKGTSSSLDFKGLYIQTKIESKGSLRIKKDLPKMIRNIKNKFTAETDNDGSDKYIIEGSFQEQALTIIDQLEALGFNKVNVSLKDGLLEIALDQFSAFPKITKNVAETMKIHQDYLIKMKTCLNVFNQIKESLEAGAVT